MKIYPVEHILQTLIGLPSDKTIFPLPPAYGTREELFAQLVRLTGVNYGDNIDNWVSWWYSIHPERIGVFIYGDIIDESQEY